MVFPRARTDESYTLFVVLLWRFLADTPSSKSRRDSQACAPLGIVFRNVHLDGAARAAAASAVHSRVQPYRDRSRANGPANIGEAGAIAWCGVLLACRPVGLHGPGGKRRFQAANAGFTRQ